MKPIEIKEKYLSRSGENHWNYKGDKLGYNALHDWIVNHYGSANHCDNCGNTKIPEGRKRWFEWSNNGIYDRNPKNWEQLCIPCHRTKDGWDKQIRQKFLNSRCWEGRVRDLEGKFR